jgi:hypothetical protein
LPVFDVLTPAKMHFPAGTWLHFWARFSEPGQCYQATSAEPITICGNRFRGVKGHPSSHCPNYEMRWEGGDVMVVFSY